VACPTGSLAISAFAQAALILDEPEYAQRARRPADFVLGKMHKTGRLARSFKNGGERMEAGEGLPGRQHVAVTSVLVATTEILSAAAGPYHDVSAQADGPDVARIRDDQHGLAASILAFPALAIAARDAAVVIVGQVLRLAGSGQVVRRTRGGGPSVGRAATSTVRAGRVDASAIPDA
jgi:hypothetical protein